MSVAGVITYSLSQSIAAGAVVAMIDVFYTGAPLGNVVATRFVLEAAATWASSAVNRVILGSLVGPEGKIALGNLALPVVAGLLFGIGCQVLSVEGGFMQDTIKGIAGAGSAGLLLSPAAPSLLG